MVCLVGKRRFFLIILTLIFSSFSYLYIERPLRCVHKVKRTTFFVASAALTTIIFSLSVSVILTNGFENRFSKLYIRIINQFSVNEFRALDHPNNLNGKHLRSGEDIINCGMREPEEACSFGDGRLVFLGDSFVSHYERAFIKIFENYGLGFLALTYEQCPFVSDQIWFGDVPECTYVNNRRKALIKDYTKSKIFIVSANYEQFDSAKEIISDPIGSGRKKLTNGPKLDPTYAWTTFFENIEWLISLGHKVVLIRSLPKQEMNSQGWIISNKDFIDNKSYPNVYNKSLRSNIKDSDMKKFSIFDNPNLIVIDPSDVLCDPQSDQCFDVMEGVGPIYNNGHLSYIGAEVVGKFVEKEVLLLGWISKL